MNKSFASDLETLFCHSQKLDIPEACCFTITPHQALPYELISEALDQYGFGIINLSYRDESATFKKIINHLGRPHAHKEEHSYLWDIQIIRKDKLTTPLARSHKEDEFHFHTDCSYEESVPDYFALYVLHADKKSGGNNLIIDVKSLKDALSQSTIDLLQNRPVTINVPQEFFKGTASIRACILDSEFNIRYRREIINFADLTVEQCTAINELEHLISLPEFCRGLTLGDDQILILSNTRFLHARTQIKDPERHLQRIRFFKTPRSSSYSDQQIKQEFIDLNKK